MNKTRLDLSIDSDTVDFLVDTLIDALDEVCPDTGATPSEVITAVFTVLEHLLRGTRKLAASEDRQPNADELKRVLTDLTTNFGHVPS